jgi:LEA14-like dessication related protein
MHKLLCLLTATAALLLAGCTTIQPPSVSLVNVQLGEVTAFETTAQFTIRLTNGTPEAVVLNGGAFKIYLNGLFVGDGVSNERIDLPRLASGTMTVSVHLSNLRLATRIRPLLESKTFDYKITGKLYASQPAGSISVSNEGRLDLNEFQGIKTGF